MERRVSALWKHNPYKKRYDFVPMGRIPANLQHAVVAAEDGRFRKHHGFDWVEMEKVLEIGRIRPIKDKVAWRFLALWIVLPQSANAASRLRDQWADQSSVGQ